VLQQRAAMMVELGQALRGARAGLSRLVVSEPGKTAGDAGAEVDRAIEVLGQPASVGSWYGAPFNRGVSLRSGDGAQATRVHEARCECHRTDRRAGQHHQFNRG
jgi:acyl-CoA reductase-like NAD-dependent aldehyde dehydrogenase